MLELLILFLFIVGLANFWLNLANFKRKDSPKRKHLDKNQVLIDTCALIDGRVLELAKTGFLPRELIVPKFVVTELQMLADGRDGLKRQRARYGLDMIKELQSSKKTILRVDNRLLNSELEVDDKLVALAKETKALLYTTDYNLNKVAEIEGVTVLNVNELSKLLRPLHLPGETAKIKIVQKGQDRSQGIGYLEDGTMVVVTKAGNKQGKTVSIEFDRHLQTSAGRMMFAKLV